jgi:hypothetical protein
MWSLSTLLIIEGSHDVHSHRSVNPGRAHWIVCLSEASRGIYISQKQESTPDTIVLNETFEVNVGVAFLVFNLHFVEQRSCATVSVALSPYMPMDELSSKVVRVSMSCRAK